MSAALVKAVALRHLTAAGGHLPAAALLGALQKELPEGRGCFEEELQTTLSGLLHRGALILDEGCYRIGPGASKAVILRAERDVALERKLPPAKRVHLEQTPTPCTSVDAALGPLSGPLSPCRAPLATAACGKPHNQSVLERLCQSSQLSEEQNHVVEAVMAGSNVFFTGLPGTGKSFTLCAVIRALRQKLRDNELAVCASTGAAACHVGGGTLHSFLGCGLGKKPEDFDAMFRNAARLRSVKTIVIDEVSMLSGEFLQAASDGLCKVRECRKRPFGGIQVILCGDFLQLPPVSDAVLDRPGARRFAFQAQCWEELGLRRIELTRNYRQAEDLAFQATLQRVRVGQLTDEDRTMLLQNSEAATEKTAVSRTTLYCRNVDVERENLTRLAELAAHEHAFKAEDSFQCRPHQHVALERILEKCMIPKELKLKVGARVMLLKNKRLPNQCQQGESPLVNGSLGEVVSFETLGPGQYQPVVQFSDGCRESIGREPVTGNAPGIGSYTRLQLPLKLAWAVSVHKSQGMTLDGGVVDLRGAFEEGQVYVALSRFRAHGALSVRGLPAQLRVSSQAIRFHGQLSAGARAAPEKHQSLCSMGGG